ncbi:MAG: UbiD family decarboxylase [Alphaproteobacteria bacterium]|nr:UbiD family decarboxylase [Alphaproteobacteria bacterium]
MAASFRGLLDDLRKAGELVEIGKPVDIRYIATLVDQSDKALMFTNVIGYDMPVVSGITNSRNRLAIAMGCKFDEIEGKLRAGLDRPIEPKMVNSGPAREVLIEGDDVDLYKLPVPLFSVLDGGPMITAGVILSKDPEHGLNAGIYRLLVKEKNLTGIDIVTPNNLHKFAQAAYKAGKPLPISVNIGTHPSELIAGCYKAPLGTSEIAISGGMRGDGVPMTPCKTIDMPCIADAEIVLEAEILPTGWTKPEGRFGEFTRLMGGLHWNPHVRVKAVSMRRNAVYYALHMPWENIWPSGPIYEAAVRRVLKEAGVQVTAVNITPGGCCHWHAVIAIRPLAGDAKNAILAALSVADMKHVTIVDHDIDVFDAVDVEWAVATRVQADRDVVIISGARSKPLDPSLVIEHGKVPVTAKMGIDATIPDNVPRERYHRISYAYSNKVRLADYTEAAATGKAAAVSVDIAALAAKIEALIAETPLYFAQLTERFEAEGFNNVARAVGQLHKSERLWQDAEGRFCLVGSRFAAQPPKPGQKAH